MPQSAYTPLDLPYMFLGLGRTNNYIENFYMGISRKDDKNVIFYYKHTPNKYRISNKNIGPVSSPTLSLSLTLSLTLRKP